MAKENEKKVFVLDTNVPMHDPTCLDRFAEHDVAIPMMVLEELDNHKNGSEQRNLNVREFVRRLDQLSGDSIFNGGISLGKGKGNLSICLGVEYPLDFEKSFMEDSPDHRILAIAYILQKEKKKNVVLVSKDYNLRQKAKALGIQAEDYRNDKVADIKVLSRYVQQVSYEEIKKLNNLHCNSFVYSGDNKPTADAYRWTEKGLQDIKRHAYACNIKMRNLEQDFARDVLLDPNIPLVAITGIAGSGKTLISIACALEQKKTYPSILVARPAVELSNKTLGFLPGGIEEKIDPYMLPLYDNIAVIQQAQQEIHKKQKKEKKNPEAQQAETGIDAVKQYMKNNNIEITVLNYVRGRTFTDTFFIVDEAQNLDLNEIKTIITRAGKGTKIVFTGDIMQIDSPYLDERSNGVSRLIEKFFGEKEFAHIELVEGERSALAEKAGKLL